MKQTYQGGELESFSHALRWKAYVRKVLHPYIAGDVVELGAGIGETTKAVRPGSGAATWLCVEPDKELASRVTTACEAGGLGTGVTTMVGTIEDIPLSSTFDTALYVDVLEHIEDDRGELVAVARRLRSGGRIVVLSPAWPFLFSAFDAAIGHHRRYTKASLRALTPEGATIEAAFYLDSFGMLASAANKILMQRSLPTLRQVLVWDRLMIPVSRLLDPLTGRKFGRSVVMVWRKN